LGDLVAEYRATGETDYAARMAPPDRGPSTGETGYGARMPDPGPSTGYVMNGPQADPASQLPPEGPATGAIDPGADVFTPRVPVTGPQPAVRPAAQSTTPTPGGRLSPNFYGMLTGFTLRDGMGPAFDRLAEQTVEAVRRGEPDTLVYA